MMGMDIAIVGTGAVAQRLAVGLVSAGHRLRGVWGRQAERVQGLLSVVARECAGAVPTIGGATVANCLALVGEEQLVNLQAEITLVCVRDAAIEPVIRGLGASAGLVAHTSGATPLMVAGQRAQGMEGVASEPLESGVFYPLFTFSLGREVEIASVPFLIQGSTPSAQATLMALAESISPGNARPTTDAQRAFYHLLGVWVNNFTNHLLFQSESLAARHGLDWQLLRPIAEETVRKAFAVGAFSAQTGPALRGDSETLARHRALLRAQEADASLITLYDQLSASIQAAVSRVGKG